MSSLGLIKSSSLRHFESIPETSAQPELVKDTVDINLNVFKHLSMTLWNFPADNSAVQRTTNDAMTSPKLSLNVLSHAPVNTGGFRDRGLIQGSQWYYCQCGQDPMSRFEFFCRFCLKAKGPYC